MLRRQWIIMVTIGKKSQNKLTLILAKSQEDFNQRNGGNLFVYSVGPSRNLTIATSHISQSVGTKSTQDKKDQE